MHRFYLAPGQCGQCPLRLSEREANHASRVLRVRPHECVVVLNGVGDEFICEVQHITRRAVALNVVRQRAVAAPPCRLTLLQAIPKGPAMETIIQKATELGVSRIVPILSERGVVRPKANELAAKAAKWGAVAIEAIKQCGSAWLPRVEIPIPLRDFVARNEAFDLALIASLEADAVHLRQHLESFVRRERRPPASACVWVGPEGDFTPVEIGAVRSSGALPITLGPLLLRSETAATCCLAVINHELRAPPPVR